MLAIIRPSSISSLGFIRFCDNCQARSPGVALLPKLTCMLTGPPEDTVLTSSGHSSTWRDGGNSVQPHQVPQSSSLVTPMGLEIEGHLSELLILQGKLAGPLRCLLSPRFSPLLSWKGVGFQGSKAGRDSGLG